MNIQPHEIFVIAKEEGKKQAQTKDLDFAVEIADAIKGQVFLWNYKAPPIAQLQLVYSYGEREAFGGKTPENAIPLAT